MEGENGFKVYLASLTGFFWDFFHGLAGFCGAWLEGTGYFLVQDSFRSSPEFRRQFQYILSRQLLSWNSDPLLRPEFCIRSHVLSRRPPSKKLNSLSRFPLTKRALLPVLWFWPIIWPLSSSSTSLCHAIHSDYYTDLYVPFSIHPVTECSQLLAFILTWIRYFLQKAGRGVNLHRLFLF